MKEIESINYDVKHASDKKIRISFSGEAGSIFIPDIIKEFYNAGITSMLETRVERSANSFSSLTNGEADVAIYSWLVPINDPDYFIRTLDETELIIITGLSDP